MKVLVVDDSAVQRKKICSFLRPLKVELFEAQDGMAAMEQLAKEPLTALLITDWNMPRMDGLCLVKAVRSDPRFRGIRIMMVTTESDPWSVTRAIRSGADEYLMKPFDQTSLLDKLRMVLSADHPELGLDTCEPTHA